MAIGEELQKIINERMWPNEVAQAYDVTEGTLAKWRSIGRGPNYYKLAGRVFYLRSDVEKDLTTGRCIHTRKSAAYP